VSETRRAYTREFKLEALRLSEDPDRRAADVARALGVSPRILYRWRQALKTKGQEAFPGHGRLPESEEKVRQLRRYDQAEGADPPASRNANHRSAGRRRSALSHTRRHLVATCRRSTTRGLHCPGLHSRIGTSGSNR